jgi:CBS domain containing-hemolysin-like protein
MMNSEARSPEQSAARNAGGETRASQDGAADPSSPASPTQGTGAPAKSRPGAPASGARVRLAETGARALAFLRSAVSLRRAGPGSLRQNLQEELAREADSNASFTPEERVLLSNILRLRELRVDDVMVPRADIDAVEDSVSLGRLMEVFRESGHSRMPVYRDGLDDPRGMVHIKDLMAHICARSTPGCEPANSNAEPDLDLSRVDLSVPLGETGLIRTVLFVPPSMPATDLMTRMQADRVQMALVIDEYGGTEGLVSLEDIVETVFGDIEDEHDEDEEAMIAHTGDGVWTADPRVPIEEVEEAIGTDFQLGDLAEEVDTLGGLVFSLVGRVPVRGELITVRELPGYEFEILDADPRRIKRLRIRAKRAAEARAARIRRPDPSA